jgi:basic membrane protein A
MIEAAKKYPNTFFCHATGTKAATAGVANYHNAFASIYEGRYLAGVAAGLKLKALYGENPSDENAKVGYVGAWPYAEVKSGYTSFFLGVRSVVPNATMEVTFTSSWYDENAERTGAELLISRGATLISQHADSYGAPNACEEAGIPNVSYNGSTLSQCPTTFLISSKINWQPYYEHVIDCCLNNKALEKDYVGSFATGSVQITEFSPNCADGTKAFVENVKAELEAGTRHVFDTRTFTVGGEAPREANCAPNKKFTFDYPEGTEFLKGGFYNESVYRSAPSFDVFIDGITNLNTVF